MRKFKVTKEFPGANVGDVLEWNLVAGGYLINGPRNGPTGNGSSLIMQPEFMKGFGEEIKEQEEFWYVCQDGEVCKGTTSWTCVPNWLRFPTKEHAQAFADFIKNTYEKKCIDDGMFEFKTFAGSLNSRRHD